MEGSSHISIAYSPSTSLPPVPPCSCFPFSLLLGLELKPLFILSSFLSSRLRDEERKTK